MIQDTSLLAYQKVQVNKRQQQILNFFKRYPKHYNWTNMEIANRLNWSINRVTPRVGELRKKGLLVTALKRSCTVTGNTAYAWRLNNN